MDSRHDKNTVHFARTLLGFCPCAICNEVHTCKFPNCAPGLMQLQRPIVSMCTHHNYLTSVKIFYSTNESIICRQTQRYITASCAKISASSES